MHEWMTDNSLTPHIVVDATTANLDLSPEHVRDDKIILNVSYAATRGLVIGNEAVAFEARFNGVPTAMNVPIESVLGIYARESGQGMVFSEEPGPSGDDPDPGNDPGTDDGPGAGDGKRPALRVVK